MKTTLATATFILMAIQGSAFAAETGAATTKEKAVQSAPTTANKKAHRQSKQEKAKAGAVNDKPKS